MRNKNSYIGLLVSLLIHVTIFALLFSACSQSQDNVAALHEGTGEQVGNFSMEMLRAISQEEETVVEDNSPEPIVEEEKKIEVADPTIKPDPIVKKEKKKEKTKPKKNKEKQKKAGQKFNSGGSANTQLGSQSVGNAPTKINGGVVNAYIRRLFNAIEKNKHYPARSVAREETGITAITFKLNEDGSIEQAFVSESSGYGALDKAAVAAVQKTKSIGERPVGVKSKQTVRMKFTINSQS